MGHEVVDDDITHDVGEDDVEGRFVVIYIDHVMVEEHI